MPISEVFKNKLILISIVISIIGVVIGFFLIQKSITFKKQAASGPICQLRSARCVVNIVPGEQYSDFRIKVVESDSKKLIKQGAANEVTVFFDALPGKKYECEVVSEEKSPSCIPNSTGDTAPVCIQLTPIPTLTISPTLTPTPTPPCPNCAPPEVLPGSECVDKSPDNRPSCNFSIIQDPPPPPNICPIVGREIKIRILSSGCFSFDNSVPCQNVKAGDIITIRAPRSGKIDASLICQYGSVEKYECKQRITVMCGPTPTKGTPPTPTLTPTPGKPTPTQPTPTVTNLPTPSLTISIPTPTPLLTCPIGTKDGDLELQPIPLPNGAARRVCRLSQAWLCKVPENILIKLRSAHYRLGVYKNGVLINYGEMNKPSHQFDAENGVDYTCRLEIIDDNNNSTDVCLTLTGRQECIIDQNKIKNPSVCVNSRGDMNGDGQFNLIDFEIFRQAYIGNNSQSAGDLNCDNKTDLMDWVELSKNLLLR